MVDTSIWIEILQKTERGKEASAKLSEKSAFTCAVAITEISKWACLNSLNPEHIVDEIEEACDGVLYTSKSSEIEAGRLCAKANRKVSNNPRKIGLIDCIIAATAEENGLTVLTKDRHFLLFEGIEKEIV